MDFYVGFCWFTGQIAHFFSRQKKRWQIIVLAVTHMFCTVNQSRVNDCFFLDFCPAKIFAKTQCCFLFSRTLQLAIIPYAAAYNQPIRFIFLIFFLADLSYVGFVLVGDVLDIQQ